MKPLPAQHVVEERASGVALPALRIQGTSWQIHPSALPQATCTTSRCYPWLLIASTTIAAIFCFMYITKPVTISATAPSHAAPAPDKPVDRMPDATAGKDTKLMPSGDHLPGEQSTAKNTAGKPIAAHPRNTLPSPSSGRPFEETNLRIQHILTAQAPGGQLDRIDIEVPVLYQSRSLRWSANEISSARELLKRLSDYQEKSQQLRAEGASLLEAWNRLVSNSIPSGQLRADSPSLPENQQDAAASPGPAGLISTDSIQIQSSGK